MAEDKISVYSLQDLKSTTDDALGNYLRGLGFKQDNSKTDLKLAVGYVAIIIAAATFAADYKLGWEATKHYTAVGVFLYAALNSYYTYLLWFVEKGLVFEGVRDGKKITIRTKVDKHDPMYQMDVAVKGSASSSQSKQIKTPFTTWFTADGFFVAKPFQQWLASSIEVIGDADTKNALRDERDELAAPISTTTQASVKADGATKRKKKTQA